MNGVAYRVGSIFAVAAMLAISANTTLASSYTQIGNTIYGSNGDTWTQIGNTLYGSDGTSYTTIGNTTYGNNGSSFTNIGNTLYGSDGTSYTTIGNTTFGSNGDSFIHIGNITYGSGAGFFHYCPLNSSYDFLSSSCKCDYGYKVTGSSCVYDIGSYSYTGPYSNLSNTTAAASSLCPVNSFYSYSTGKCTCNYGYVASGSQCITETQSCQNTYGYNSYGIGGYCYCGSGYQFNTLKTYCVAKSYTSSASQTANMYPSVTNDGLSTDGATITCGGISWATKGICNTGYQAACAMGGAGVVCNPTKQIDDLQYQLQALKDQLTKLRGN